MSCKTRSTQDRVRLIKRQETEDTGERKMKAKRIVIRLKDHHPCITAAKDKVSGYLRIKRVFLWFITVRSGESSAEGRKDQN